MSGTNATPSYSAAPRVSRLVSLAFLLPAFAVYASLVFHSNGYVLLGQGLLWMLAIWNRRWPLFALTLMFPLFGNQPGAPYGVYFIEMSLWFVVLRWLWERWRRGYPPFIRTILTPWLVLLWLISLASIMPHAMDQLRLLKAQGGWMKGIFEAYQSTAFNPLFPVHAFFNATLSLLFFFYLADQWRRAGDRLRLMRNLIIAAFAAMAFGLLDFLRVLPLEWFRPPNPEILKFGYPRLQSFFWHSGWFAQWLLLLAPLALAFALFCRRRALLAWRTGAGTFAFGAVVVMLLTYQRGGWLSLAASYAVVLALYLLKQIGARAGRRRALVLGGILLAAALLGAGSLLFLDGGQRASLARRLQHTGELRDRTAIWQSALILSKQHPFLGVGLGRYYSEHIIQFPKGNPYYSIDKGEAHNTYLHFLAERGPLSLLVLLLLFYVALRHFHRCWKNAGTDSNRAWWVAGALGMLAGWLVYGCAQYMFYIRVVDHTFWIAFAAALMGSGGVGRARNARAELALRVSEQKARAGYACVLAHLLQRRMPSDESAARSQAPASALLESAPSPSGLSLSGLAWMLGPLCVAVGCAIVLRFLFGGAVEDSPAARNLGYGVFSYGWFLGSGFFTWLLVTGAVPLAVRRPSLGTKDLVFLQLFRLFLLSGWWLFFIGTLGFLVDIPFRGDWQTLGLAWLCAIASINLSLLLGQIWRALAKRSAAWRFFLEPFLLTLFLATPVLYPHFILPKAARLVLWANPAWPSVRIGQILFFEQARPGWALWGMLLFWTALFALLAALLRVAGIGANPRAEGQE